MALSVEDANAKLNESLREYTLAYNDYQAKLTQLENSVASGSVKVGDDLYLFMKNEVNRAKIEVEALQDQVNKDKLVLKQAQQAADSTTTTETQTINNTGLENDPLEPDEFEGAEELTDDEAANVANGNQPIDELDGFDDEQDAGFGTQGNDNEQTRGLTFSNADQNAQADSIEGTATTGRVSSPESQDAAGSNTADQLKGIPPSQTGSDNKNTTNTSKNEIQVTPNPLHDYVNYTYQLTLHMLTKSEFNDMVKYPDGDGPGGPWGPKHTLIAGAGKYGGAGSGFQREAAFDEDFYFDNLKLTTIVGLNQNNQGTNAINISFTIVEPYGFTLIDRLIKAVENSNTVSNTKSELGAEKGIDGKNYLQIPYLLQIDFYGYDDEGVQVSLRKHRKYIPIKLVAMKVQVGVKGAEYRIEAVPYNHGGLMQSIAATPANFEVTAASLEEFFKADANVEEAVKQYNERQEAQAKAQKDYDAQVKGGDSARQQQSAENLQNARSATTGQGTGNAYSVRSYVAAYNAWSKNLKDKNWQTDFNTIAVTFDANILANGGSKITNTSQPVKQTSNDDTTDQKTKAKAAAASAQKSTYQPNTNVGRFSINGGTNVIEVINQMMRNSEFIRRQVKDPTKEIETDNIKTEDKVVNWWKIIPSVQLRKFDPKTNHWMMDVTYHVITYKIYNRNTPALPKAMPQFWHKEYNYIYTGHNNDIIDFQINFDALFYTAATVQGGKVTSTTTSGQQAQEDNIEKNPDVKSDSDKTRAGPNPVQIKNQSDSINTTNAGNVRKDSLSMAVADANQSVAANAQADMLSVQIKIVGDPMFIKQDDLYDNPGAAKYAGQAAGSYGGAYVKGDRATIAMDGGEVHAKLTWKTPVDIDESTGRLRTDASAPTIVSGFSGIYKLLQVESNFQSGKFEQTLEMIRLQAQPQDVTAIGQDAQKTGARPGAAESAPANGGPEVAEDEYVAETQRLARAENNATNADPDLDPANEDASTNMATVDRDDEIDLEGADPLGTDLASVVNDEETAVAEADSEDFFG